MEGRLPCQPAGYRLIIAEKPKAAYRIARALSGGSMRKCEAYGAPYWVLSIGGRIYIVASAVGHLFGIAGEEPGFPVFKYRWVPIFEAEKGAGYTKKYFYALRKLCRGALEYINACDYDIEGSLIGYMVIREFGEVSRAKRMKFSSLTEEELRTAFRSLLPLDMEMVEAGMCRHELDWLWGINVSRALMRAVRLASGRRVVLSAGRVQSPTLVEVVERDLARRLFLPLPLFNINVKVRVNGKDYTMEALGGPYKSRAEAEAAAGAVRRSGRLTVEKASRRRVEEQPPPAFNLPDLQAEASRIYGFSPLKTQRIAEQLYLNALISYPRTNSQRLPETLDYESIMRSLSSMPEYSGLVDDLMRETLGRLRPRQGKKTDPAHPAIYPTGKRPYKLGPDEAKIYDLIVRRFMAAFSKPAVYERVEIIASASGLRFRAAGVRLVERGWTRYYPFSARKESEVFQASPGDELQVSRVSVSTTYTKPPPPYTKAGIVKWMENVGIGTEATRARISEVLFKRGYLESRGRVVEATDLGISVAEILRKYFSDLTSVELTRRFEEKMEAIRRGETRREEVLEEAKRLLKTLIGEYMSTMREAGRDLARSLGLVTPPRRCVICGREEKAQGFCTHHLRALEELRKGEAEWGRRAGITGRRYLEKISKMNITGKWVREVAQYMLKNGQWRD